MNDSDRSKLYLDRLLKHQELTRSKKFYAIQRIDLLIISISGAGIYVIFEIMRFYLENGPQGVPDLGLIKIAGCFFAFAIIINFISQWTGYQANNLNGKVSNQIFQSRDHFVWIAIKYII